MTVWHPRLAIRVMAVVLTAAFTMPGVGLAVAAAFYHSAFGILSGLVYAGFWILGGLVLAFWVAMVIDPISLRYRSIRPWAMKRIDVGELRLRRKYPQYLALAQLHVVDRQGAVVRRVTNVWSTEQLTDIAASLAVPLTITFGSR